MNRIPWIASGKIVPGGNIPLDIQIKRAKEKEEKRAQRRHDYFVAAFSSVCGGITGFLASLIFWLSTK